MRTSMTQNVLYDYRYLSVNKEVRYNLENAFHLRRDFTKMEEESKCTITERLMYLGAIVGAVSCLYFLLSIIS